MKLSHSLLAAALTSTLVLSACTGDDDADSTATGSTGDSASATGGAADDGAEATGDAAGATGDAAGATGDAAGATDDAAGATSGADESAEDEGPAGTLSIEEADTWAEQLLTEGMESTQLDGQEAVDSRELAFAGAELEAQMAAGRLEPVEGKPAEWDAEESPVDFSVLAISRSGARGPGLVLVQSVPEEGTPVLSLIARQSDPSEFRIVWQASMLPGTSLGEFDRRSAGSPTSLRDDDEGLTASPAEVLEELAAYLSFPSEGEETEIRTNGYAPAVRQEAQAQANDVSVQAEFTQSHELSDQQLFTLRLADGSGLSLGVLDRESVFDVYSGMELTPPDTWWYFTRDRAVTDEARLNTSVFVAVHIPEDGDPEVIAAREQIVGGEGD